MALVRNQYGTRGGFGVGAGALERWRNEANTLIFAASWGYVGRGAKASRKGVGDAACSTNDPCVALKASGTIQ